MARPGPSDFFVHGVSTANHDFPRFSFDYFILYYFILFLFFLVFVNLALRASSSGAMSQPTLEGGQKGTMDKVMDRNYEIGTTALNMPLDLRISPERVGRRTGHLTLISRLNR